MPAETTKPIVILPELWQRPEVMSALRERNIGQLFRLIRQYAGFSPTCIGVAVNLSQGKVSEIMKGSAQVTSFEVFERIAEGLQMPDPGRMILSLAPIHPPAPRTIDAVPYPPHPSRLGMEHQQLPCLAWRAPLPLASLRALTRGISMF